MEGIEHECGIEELRGVLAGGSTGQEETAGEILVLYAVLN
jgi:hypothetical protein